jgi:hypothetical protein
MSREMMRSANPPVSEQTPEEEDLDRATVHSPPPDFAAEDTAVERYLAHLDTLPDDFDLNDSAQLPDAYRAEAPTQPELEILRYAEQSQQEEAERNDTEPAPPPDSSEPL